MAEEEHTHGLAHGHHKEGGKDKDRALYWGLGLSAVGVLIAVLLFMGGGNKTQQAGQGTLVHQSEDYIPNPTDISIGSNAAPLFWPALPTSGTPTKPKTHHHGDSDHDNDAAEKKKKASHGHTNKSNDKKGYGTSPTGASHGHTVTTHTHNPVVLAQHTKGNANG